ncbi:TAXI family TRAP transporter solute-binding subunit [Oscillospiraceae bacterium LTW-04]|nr:TAXI family TRAP transporter solute-binding subunit [Oscillospiraceae bacterium MB24-C1]
MKKYLAISMALALVLVLAACGGTSSAPASSAAPAPSSAAPAPSEAPAGPTIDGDFIMATGGTSGTYYAFGGVICQVINGATGSNITANSTGASVENIRLLESGDVDFGIVQTDIMAYAVGGTTLETFDGQPVNNVKAVASLYPEVVHCVTTNMDINTIADLKGKVVSMGAPGSGTRANAEQFLEAYGLTAADVQVRDLSFAESGSALQDGTIDAAFVVAGAPNSAITELSVSKPVKIVSIGDAERAAMIEKYPFYADYTVGKDVYKTEADATTLAIKAVLICRAELSDDDVYAFTKALFENQADLASAHAKGTELSSESAMIGIVPGNVHPGAAKYYTEIGVKVP